MTVSCDLGCAVFQLHASCSHSLCHINCRCTIRRKAHAISSSEYIHTSSSFAGGSRTNGGSKPLVDTPLQHQELMLQPSLLEFKVNIKISISSSSSTDHITKVASKCLSKHSWKRRSIQDLVYSCQVLIVKQVQ